MHRFGSPFGVLADNVFEHDHVAGLAHRIIRFRGDDQREGLKIGGYVHLAAVVVAHQDFSQIYGPAFGRDGPQDVGQIFVAECGGPFQVAKFHFDFDVALLAFHLGLAVGLRHQVGAGKIHLGGPAAMLVVDGLHIAADHGDPEGRRVVHGFDHHGGLRIGLRKRAQTEGDAECQQNFSLQRILLKADFCRAA